jgi:hypothetical protein
VPLRPRREACDGPIDSKIRNSGPEDTRHGNMNSVSHTLHPVTLELSAQELGESGSARELMEMSSPYDDFEDIECGDESAFTIDGGDDDDDDDDRMAGREKEGFVTRGGGKGRPKGDKKKVSFDMGYDEIKPENQDSAYKEDSRNERERERDEEVDGLLEEVLGTPGGNTPQKKLFEKVTRCQTGEWPRP